MADDCGDFDPDDCDYAEIPDDDFLFGEHSAYSPPPPSALQQGMLLGPELLVGPYQRGRATLSDILGGIPIEVSPYLPKGTAYLFPAIGDHSARFVSHPHYDWSWRVFLWNQRHLARQHLAQLVRETEERLGLSPEPPPERISPRALSSFRGHILQGEIATIAVPRLDWELRWMPLINSPLVQCII